MRLARRISRYAGFTLLAAAALAAGAAGVLTLTESGRGTLAGIVSQLASGPERTVRVSGIDGIWSGHLSVRQVVVEDARGPWLAASGVEIDWSPLSLLGFTFEADRVRAGRVELARLPEAGEGGGSSGLPLELDIRSIELPEIALGDGIAGSVTRLAATGSLRVEGGPLAVDAAIAMHRTDGRQGSLSARLAYAPEENRLDLKVEGAEPAGGLIAGLLRLPGRPAVAITAEGSGPASDWAGQARFAVDGETVTRLDLRHQLTDAGNRIEASGSGDFASFLPAGLAPLAAGSTEFEFAGTLGPDRAAAVETASLRSGAIEAQASGTVDANALSDFSLQARATGGPVRLRFGQGAGEAEMLFDSAGVRLFGPGDALAIDGTAQLPFIGTDDHTAEDVSLTLRSEAFDIGARAGRLTLAAKAQAAGSANAVVAGLLAGGIEAEADLDIDGNAIGFATKRVHTGTADIAANGTFARDTGALAADARAQFLAAVLPAAARAPLDRTVSVSGRVERTAEGAFSLSGLEAASGAFTASGSAALGEELTAEIAGRIGDLSRLSDRASGAAAFTLSAGGAPERPDFALSLSSERMEVAGRAIEGLKLEAAGVADPRSPSGRLRLTGTVGGEALSGSATLPAGGGVREITDLELALGENRLTGVLRIDEALLPQGDVQFSLPEIAPLAALALLDASGSARGSLRLAVADGRPSATLDAIVDSFSMGDIAAGEVRVNATAEDYLSRPSIAGAASAGRIVSGGTEFRDVEVALTQEGGWTGFDGRVSANGIPLTASGRARLSDGRATVELATATASLRGIEAALAKPATVTVEDGSARLDGLSIAAAGGTAEISGTAGGTLDLSLRLASLPAAAFNAFAPGFDAAGTLSGTARISGPAADPKVSYEAQWQGGQLAQTRAAGFGPMSVTSSGNYAGGVVTFRASVGDGSGLTMSGGGSANLRARSVDVKFDGRVPFSFLARRLAAQGVGLDGTAEVTLTVSGDLGSPQVGGSLRTGGARLVHAASGIAVNELAADIALGGGAATVNRLSGTLSGGGTVSGSGRVTIDPAAGFPAELSLAIENGRYTDGRVVTSSFDGQLKLSGALASAPLLSGEVNLGRTVITIPERLPGSLATLDVQHRNAPAAVRRQDAALNPSGGAGGGGGFALDLQVNAPQQIFVQGRGLDAELGGSLRLTGPASAAQAVGQFTMRRGRLSLLGRRMEFTRGTLGFSGSLIPYLNLAAETRAEDATVTVLVTGPANDPAFAFQSSPALPEDEILARLVFGKAMSGLSPVQIAQLAAAAGQLAGIGGPTTLLQQLRESTGLDDLDIRTDEETGDTSLAIGKRLGERTYLSIEKGSQPGSGKATIDLDIGRGLKLRGEASDDGKTRGGIFYEKEY